MSDRDGPDATEERKLPLGERVFRDLVGAIRGGDLKPGERVREVGLAKKLGVSRTPVREAIRRLQTEGLLVQHPWQGTTVAELDETEIVELYALRRVLEGTAAGLAARHAADSQIAALRRLVELAAEESDANRLAELNRRLHQGIYTAAHNRYLVKALNSFRDSLALLHGTTFAIADRAQSAQEEHVRIVEAIAARDVETAEQAALDHIAMAERARLELMQMAP